MTGIDKEFALLQMVRADLSVKWKILSAESNSDRAGVGGYAYAFAA